jgi:8-oxo-dGTP diphosphatase
MKKLIGFVLFIIASGLKVVVFPVAYIFGTFTALIRKEWNEYNHNLALAVDQYGNALCKYLFDLLFIEKESKYKFGNPDETISSVIGKNKVAETLTVPGEVLDWILNKFEKNHSINSIDISE